MEAIYLYGLIEADQERGFGPIGFGGCKVSTLPHRDLAAVVSPSPLLSFDGLTRETLLHYLFAHQSVVEKVMGEGYTVVPFKFGTVARDGGEARRILREGYPHLKGTLLACRGKTELDVVAVWNDLQVILQEIGEQEEIRRFKEALASRPPQETLEGRIQIGRLVKAALDEQRDRLAVEFLETLKGLAANVRCHDLLDESMIMNVAFLMDKGQEQEFERALNQLGDRYDGRVNFRCIGPLPPYSFSTVEVKRIPVEAVERARRLLGVPSGATFASIKKAYRQAVQRYHPDKTRSTRGIDGRFQELKEAYQLLVEVFHASQPPGLPAGELLVIKVG